MEGDAEHPDFGLDAQNKTTIKNEVNIIINNASAISFDENLRRAINVNVIGLVNLIRIAKTVKALKAFLQISTVFSNFPRSEIEEIVYDSPMPIPKVIAVAETMTDMMLEDSYKMLLGDWPNPYVFSKAVAESVVREEGKNLPICIIRPSIGKFVCNFFIILFCFEGGWGSFMICYFGCYLCTSKKFPTNN